MKSVGEVMAIGRTFKEALMKAFRSLETGRAISAEVIEPRRLTQRLVTPHPDRLAYIRYAFRCGQSVREVAWMTSMDPWFLQQIKEITECVAELGETTYDKIAPELLRKAKRMGISDARLADVWGIDGPDAAVKIRELRLRHKLKAGLQTGRYMRGGV